MEKAIYEFEGTDLEHEIDRIALQCNWGDEIWLSPTGKVLRVDANDSLLFRRQNFLVGWMRVIWGTELK